MATYLTLMSFTDEGAKHVGRSPERAEKFRKKADAAGASVIGQYWSLGEFDGVLLFEAPDEKVAGRLMLGLAQDGSVRTETHRLLTNADLAGMIPPVA